MRGIEYEIINDVGRLAESAQVKALECVSAIETFALPFKIFETLRIPERQQMLFDHGYSKTLKSQHLKGMAWDIVYFGRLPNGKESWAWPDKQNWKDALWFDAYLRAEYMAVMKLFTGKIAGIKSGLIEWHWDFAHVWAVKEK